MSACPICGNSIAGLICTSCGFDGSCNYEEYPTLADTISSEAVSQLKKKHSEKSCNPARNVVSSSLVSLLNNIQQKKTAGLLQCQNCGGVSFSFRLSDNALICTGCKHVLRDFAFNKDYVDKLRRESAAIATIPASLGAPIQNTAHRIAAREGHTIYVCNDGTAKYLGPRDEKRKNAINAWRNIIDVESCFSHTIGLRSDGTVVKIGTLRDVETWKNVECIAITNTHAVGVCRNGKVLVSGFDDNLLGRSDIESWNNIVAVAAALDFITVGLHRNGTVVVAGDRFYSFKVNSWKDIAAISAIGRHLAGLCRNGTVIATGNNDYGQCNTAGWRNIIAVSAGGNHTVGLCSDGTVVATGKNDEGQCNVSGWRDIVSIVAGDYHTVGLHRDGTLVAVGRNGAGQCDVAGIRLW